MITTNTLVNQAIRGQANRHWYAIGREQMTTAANQLNSCPRQFALLLSAYSPRVHVARAFKNAVYHVEHGTRPPGSMALHWKLATEGLDRGYLLGPKIEAFRRAILGEPDALVIDVWAARGLRVEQRRVFLKSVYPRIERLFNRAADRLGWSVSEVQASQWLTVRREHGFKNSPLVPVGLGGAV